MSEVDKINKIKQGINNYFKLKFFTIYIVFMAFIFYLNHNMDMAMMLLAVAFLYLILLSRHKEEFIDGKE